MFSLSVCSFVCLWDGVSWHYMNTFNYRISFARRTRYSLFVPKVPLDSHQSIFLYTRSCLWNAFFLFWRQRIALKRACTFVKKPAHVFEQDQQEKERPVAVVSCGVRHLWSAGGDVAFDNEINYTRTGAAAALDRCARRLCNSNGIVASIHWRWCDIVVGERPV